MAALEFGWYFIAVFLIVLTVLVFVHEYGHYWVARRNNVRVEVFSIGFGPEIYGWTAASGTRWKISAIPLGGYVKMFGEGDQDDDASKLSEQEKEVSFHYKTVGQRAAIVAAGPIVNFIFAIFAFAVLAGVVGNPVPLASVGSVVEGSAAEKAGFEPGDQFVSIDGEPVKYFNDLSRVVSENPGRELGFVVVRDNSEILIKATPDLHKRTNEDGAEVEIGRIGVAWNPDLIEYERQGPLRALWTGVERTYVVTSSILVYIGDMITGNRGTEELGGPLRIAQISGEMAKQGVAEVIFLMAMLSVNLGLINLFPIPMLDGGHLAFYSIEALLGKPLSLKAQEYGFRFGLILVLMLVVFVTWNDLVHLEVIESIKGLFV